METMTGLKLALAATRRGQSLRLASRARKSGVQPFRELWSLLSADDARRIDDEAANLQAKGVIAVLLGSEQYPSRLASVRGAPPALFCRGPVEFLHSQGVGMCGSRNAAEN